MQVPFPRQIFCKKQSLKFQYMGICMATYYKALAIVKHWRSQIIHMLKFISSSGYSANSKNYVKNPQNKRRASVKFFLASGKQQSCTSCPSALLLFVRKPWAISNWTFPHPHCSRQCWALIVRFHSFRGRPERLH